MVSCGVWESSLYEGRMVIRNLSKMVHLHQESRDSSCENVSPCADRAEVDSHASCKAKSTYAQLASFEAIP